jgi:two-component system phosphate regulon sensor histidine kinase PhoR
LKSLPKQLFIVLAGVLPAVVLTVLLPIDSLFPRASISLLLATVSSLLVLRYVQTPLRNFLEQLRILTLLGADGITAERMPLFRDKELRETARAVNEMLEETARRTESIRREREKFASILDELSDGVLAVDAEGRVTYLNNQARELLDVRDGDPKGRLVSEITRIEDVQSALSDCLEEQSPVRHEGKQVSPDEERILNIDATPLRDPDGELVGAVAAIHDVTELRRLQTVRQDFVANVSHELKTPITAIQGLVETLAGDDDMEVETRQRFIEKIRNQTLRMSDMVEDLLTISRLESDDKPSEQQRFNLLDPIREAVETVQPSAQRKDHELETQLPEEPPYVEGDPAAVRRLLNNLLENAVKYTGEGGQIELRVRRDGDSALIEVEDNGAGIEPRKQERIFERFYRVDDARTRDAGGTGLGLAIVKHLTLTLNGEIEVESTPGRGSTFTVSLPLTNGS